MEKIKKNIVLQITSISLILFAIFRLKIFNDFESFSNILKYNWNPYLTSLGGPLLLSLIVEYLKKKYAINRILSLTVVYLVLSIVVNGFTSSLIFLFYLFSSYLLGVLISSLLNKEKDKSHYELFLLGYSLFGLITYLLIRLPIHNFYTYSICLLTITSFFVVQKKLKNIELKFNLKEIEIPFYATPLLLLYLLLALMPETGYDALVTHLFIPQYISHNSLWVDDPASFIFSTHPHLVDIIFTNIFILTDGEAFLRIFNLLNIILLTFYIKNFITNEYKKIQNLDFIWLLIFTTPLTYMLISSLYVDSLWTSLIVVSIINIYSYAKIGKIKYIISSSIFLGFSLAAKTISVIYIPIIFVSAIKKIIEKKHKVVFIYCVFIVFALGAYPYINSYLATANPVFPFFNDFFKSVYYPAEKFVNHYSSGLDLKFLYSITFKSHKFIEGSQGASSFYFFLCLIPVLFANKFDEYKLSYFLVISILAIWLTFMGSAYLRYIYPCFILFYIYIVGNIPTRTNNAKIIIATILIATIFNLLHLRSSTPYGYIDNKIIFQEKERKKYLEIVSPQKILASEVNELNTTKSPVLFFSSPMISGVDSLPIMHEWYNPNAHKMLMNLRSKNEFESFIRTYKTKFIIFDKNWNKIRLNAEIDYFGLYLNDECQEIRNINKTYFIFDCSRMFQIE